MYDLHGEDSGQDTSKDADQSPAKKSQPAGENRQATMRPSRSQGRRRVSEVLVLPRMRGDPYAGTYMLERELRSPHARGCPDPEVQPDVASVLLPVHTGVIRTASSPLTTTLAVPRTRGGYPDTMVYWWNTALRSPRTRGGDPMDWPIMCSPSPCSSHARGWSVLSAAVGEELVVLPVRAGVIRTSLLAFTVPIRVPRPCGGDPMSASISVMVPPCSPYARG